MAPLILHDVSARPKDAVRKEGGRTKDEGGRKEEGRRKVRSQKAQTVNESGLVHAGGAGGRDLVPTYKKIYLNINLVHAGGAGGRDLLDT